MIYEHYSADSYLLVVDNMLRKDLQWNLGHSDN